MLIKDILSQGKTCCSFEFFPPKEDKQWDGLFATLAELESLHGDFVSVTYGAGGTTRDRTQRLIMEMKGKTPLPIISHLTCVNSDRDEIREILHAYRDNGINNILALRGDPPLGAERKDLGADGFPYAADLVRFIKETCPEMSVGVACFPEGHPATPNRLQEMDYLRAKVDEGADFMMSQLFFDNRDYYDFCERCQLAGIKVPVVAGILPITSRAGMIRMAELAAGSRIPAPLLRAVEQAEHDDAVKEVGINWAADQVSDLVANKAAGIHFYTLNQAGATRKIFEILGAEDSAQLVS